MQHRTLSVYLRRVLDETLKTKGPTGKGETDLSKKLTTSLQLINLFSYMHIHAKNYIIKDLIPEQISD